MGRRDPGAVSRRGAVGADRARLDWRRPAGARHRRRDRSRRSAHDSRRARSAGARAPRQPAWGRAREPEQARKPRAHSARPACRRRRSSPCRSSATPRSWRPACPIPVCSSRWRSPAAAASCAPTIPPRSWRRSTGCAASCDPDVRLERDAVHGLALIESFVPGQEFAVEGLLHHGAFRALAIFDKPDPLDGPFFEETIYVTPSRASRGRTAANRRRSRCRGRGARPPAWAGPRGVPRERPRCLRARSGGAADWRIVRARRCASADPDRRASCHSRNCSCATPSARTSPGSCASAAASGVMMIPIPHRGVFRGVQGLEDAQRVQRSRRGAPHGASRTRCSCRCRRGGATWDSSSRAARRPPRSSARCAMRTLDSTL